LREPADRRREGLELYCADRISAELFADEERTITTDIQAAQHEASGLEARLPTLTGLQTLSIKW
jgi:hypothetical protein